MNGELTTTSLGKMTNEQVEAYSEFVDYLVKLYNEYGHLVDNKNEA